jgi:hypothetical protein
VTFTVTSRAMQLRVTAYQCPSTVVQVRCCRRRPPPSPPPRFPGGGGRPSLCLCAFTPAKGGAPN